MLGIYRCFYGYLHKIPEKYNCYIGKGLMAFHSYLFFRGRGKIKGLFIAFFYGRILPCWTGLRAV